MSELDTYSIETDHIVLLVFTDGRRKRVPIDDLRHYLSVKDLAKVRASLKLRRHFLHHHMPKAAFALAAGSALAMMAVATKPLAAWWTAAPGAVPTPEPYSQIVRSLPDTSAAQRGTPLPAPATPTDRQPVVLRTTPTSTPARKTKPKIASKPAGAAVVVANLSPAGASATLPLPTLPTLLPTPTPTPAPNAGQVLGDSTGPDDPTPSPQPGPTPTPSPTPSVSPEPNP